MINPVSPVAQTKSGKIEGLNENGLWVFKGVPFAAPPIGPLRWAPPQPHPGWEGIRSAKQFGRTSLQPTMQGNPPPGFGEPEEMDEDCLFLNIWTPGLDDKKRPVMVWIHGGAFVMGSGSQSSYRGGRLSKNCDVVLVSINYRLGLLGFLNLEIATDGKIPASGNEALLDQVAALKWVKENISAFGGDPGNVTVLGESAGAMSIGCLMAMPAAQGLFHKAILESGTGSYARPLEQMVAVARDFLKLAGWDGSNVDHLKRLTAADLLKIQTELTLRSPGGLTPVTPVIDGKILPAPLEALKSGASPGVKCIIGTNLDEWSLFEMMAPQGAELTDEGLAKNLTYMIPPQKVADLISAYRSGLSRRGGPVTPRIIMAAIRTDMMFRMPAVRLAEVCFKNKQDTYMYLFTWESPAMNGALGACHALEIGFVFGDPEPTFCGSGPDVDKLSDEIQRAWSAFARTGNPSIPQLGDWPQYSAKRETMILGKISHVEEAPYEEERAIWDKIENAK
ncbi:MAG TPA: carboxylesterase/lipase family protein [Dehalococcoidales bacterium]|nr:carboxylesterase/lipase family protein [Dehalococcoidales bacterium]